MRTPTDGRAVKLSLIMPVFNEESTIRHALERVAAVDYPCPVELIVVDDGSSDGTPGILDDMSGSGAIIYQHPVNRGKGAAVRTGVRAATGTHILILDADLEYSPTDIPAMMAPVIAGVSDYVFGARVFGHHTRFPSFRYALGGRATTHLANVLFDSYVSDMHTCFKLIPRSAFDSLSLTQNGFGLDTQLTARILRAGIRPYEVPISYNGRTAADGKKISWTDGFSCLAVLAATRIKPRPSLPAKSRPAGSEPRIVVRTLIDTPVEPLVEGVN